MSKLEELIEQYCPDGVEYVRFVDYANVLYGCPFNAAQFTNDSSYIPLIRIRDVLSGKACTYYKGEYSHDYIIKKGDILVGMDGNFNLGIWDDIDGLLCQRVCKLYTKDETRLLNGFIRHYMKPVFRQIEESTPGGSVKHLSAKAINSIHIPLPPLPVQEEIVRVLDTFTELQAELQAELQKRKQQYNFYRDNLLNFKDINRGGQEIKWMKMSEVCNIKGRIGFRGYTRNDQVKRGEGALSLSPSNISNGKMDYSKGTYITWTKYDESPEIQTFNGDIIFCKTASIGKVAFVTNLPCKATINPQLVVLKDIKCSARFLSYFLETNYIQNIVMSLAGIGSVPNISQKALSDILIPIPPLEEQNRIVSILDRFDTLTNDLTSGLPAEMEKRRQQYEFYRDKLLTFKRKEA